MKRWQEVTLTVFGVLVTLAWASLLVVLAIKFVIRGAMLLK